MIKIDITRHLDPEMAAAIAESARLYAEIVAERGPVAPDDLAGQRASYNHERAFWNAIKPALAAVEPLEIAGPDGAIPCRLYRPSTATPLPALVYFHGGGWILGNLDTHDRIMRLLAEKSGAAVLGVDYRLAPEHKFPAAYDDALAAFEHLRREGPALGIDPARLALGGEFRGRQPGTGDLAAARGRGAGRRPLPAALLRRLWPSRLRRRAALLAMSSTG